MKSETKVEVGQLIDERPLSGLQITVMILSFLVVWLDGYHIQSMSLVVPTLSEEWAVKATDFKLVVSSALVGILLGSAFLAGLGDRLGRRKLLIFSMAIIGFSSIGTGLSTGMTHLVIWRFLTGLGLGASIANATALTSDYVPSKRRALLVTIMFSGVAIGAFTSGYIGPWIIDGLGWKGMFMIGGAVPLGVAVLLAFALPESLRLMLVSNPEDARIAKILRRMAPDVDPRSVFARKPDVQRASVAELLGRNYLRGTVLLWFVFFANMFILYLLVNWLPTLLSMLGWSVSDAMRGTVMIQVGGVVGGLILSQYVDKGKTVGATMTAFLLCAAAFGLFAVLPSSGISWWLLLLVVGGGISGGQFVVIALASGFYPPVIRSTGVGWAFTIGRIAAVLSSYAGGFMLEKLGPVGVLGSLVIPVLLCIAGVLMFKNTFHAAPAAKAAAAR